MTWTSRLLTTLRVQVLDGNKNAMQWAREYGVDHVEALRRLRQMEADEDERDEREREAAGDGCKTCGLHGDHRCMGTIHDYARSGLTAGGE